MQEPVIKYIDACDHDLAAAQVLLDNGHEFYVPFFCHQALHKILRGYSLQILNRYPPITHDLLAIADETEAGLRMEDDGTRDFVGSLSVYPEVIQNPVYRQKIIKSTADGKAEQILLQTRMVVEMVRALF